VAVHQDHWDHQARRVHLDHLGRRDLRVHPDLAVQRAPPVRRGRRRDHPVRQACRPVGVVALAGGHAVAEIPVAAHSGVEEL